MKKMCVFIFMVIAIAMFSNSAMGIDVTDCSKSPVANSCSTSCELNFKDDYKVATQYLNSGVQLLMNDRLFEVYQDADKVAIKVKNAITGEEDTHLDIGNQPYSVFYILSSNRREDINSIYVLSRSFFYHIGVEWNNDGSVKQMKLLGKTDFPAIVRGDTIKDIKVVSISDNDVYVYVSSRNSGYGSMDARFTVFYVQRFGNHSVITKTENPVKFPYYAPHFVIYDSDLGPNVGHLYAYTAPSGRSSGTTAGKLLVYDLENRTNPVKIGTISSDLYHYSMDDDLFVYGNHLYAYGTKDGKEYISSYNLDNPLFPRQVLKGDTILKMRIDGQVPHDKSKLIIHNDDYYYLLDVSNPMNLQLLEKYEKNVMSNSTYSDFNLYNNGFLRHNGPGLAEYHEFSCSSGSTELTCRLLPEKTMSPTVNNIDDVYVMKNNHTIIVDGYNLYEYDENSELSSEVNLLEVMQDVFEDEDSSLESTYGYVGLTAVYVEVESIIEYEYYGESRIAASLTIKVLDSINNCFFTIPAFSYSIYGDDSDYTNVNNLLDKTVYYGQLSCSDFRTAGPAVYVEGRSYYMLTSQGIYGENVQVSNVAYWSK